MQKHLSQPIFTPRSAFMRIYIHASADDMVGISNQKKKYWGVLDVKVPFFEKNLNFMRQKKKNVCNVDADAEMPMLMPRFWYGRKQATRLFFT